MNTAQNSNGYKNRFYRITIKQALLCAFFLFALVVMYRLTGFAVIGTLIGLCALFSPIFLTEPAKYYCSRRTRANKAKTSPIKRILLIMFFIAALAIMFKLTGFLVIGVLIGLSALFAPIFLTKASRNPDRTNIFTDPLYKGLSGNLYNDKK